jgi:hypothetical protein
MNRPARRWDAVREPATAPDNPVLTRHQAFIQALPCTGCGKPASSECASVWRGLGLGIGSASADRYLVPLCGPATIWEDCCHSRRHYLGQTRFWTGLGIDPLDLAILLWRVSGDVAAGERAVRHARQGIATSRRYPMWRGGELASPRRAERSCWRTSSQIRAPAIVQGPADKEAALLLESGA